MLRKSHFGRCTACLDANQKALDRCTLTCSTFLASSPGDEVCQTCLAVARSCFALWRRRSGSRPTREAPASLLPHSPQQRHTHEIGRAAFLPHCVQYARCPSTSFFLGTRNLFFFLPLLQLALVYHHTSSIQLQHRLHRQLSTRCHIFNARSRNRSTLKMKLSQIAVTAAGLLASVKAQPAGMCFVLIRVGSSLTSSQARTTRTRTRSSFTSLLTRFQPSQHRPSTRLRPTP